MERESHQLLPVQKREKQRRENERRRPFPSSSTTGSIREDVSRDHSALTIAYLPEQHYPTQLFENNTEQSTNDTSFESHFGKTRSASNGLGAGHKRKHQKELGSADTESRKRPRKSGPAAVSPNLDPKERLPTDGLSKKQKVQFEEAVPRTSVPVIENPDKPAKELGAREIEQKEHHNPISYWATNHSWPKNFAEENLMVSLNSINKRQRTSDYSQSGKDERSRSYSQSRKNGEVPEQYTAAYEKYILTKGLNMDYRKGEDLVFNESKTTCAKLLQTDIHTLEPTALPQDKIRDMVADCSSRNEGIVNRDITQLIIPSIRLSYYCGASHLEHVIDEVKAVWYDQCVLAGPRPCPDLAIGLLSSAFTEEEIEKLKRYNSVNNWKQVTSDMFFPFIMCEAKCGREGLDIADRQNMHSCSVAVRALVRIESEADKYRQEKEIEKKADSLNGQVLVFSISHDQSDARLYGHYAIVQGEKWTYYRYPIQKFDLTKKDSLLAIHNFVRNILKSHLPEHVRRLKDALAALPDPNKPPESSGLPSSSGLSFAASEISLNDDNSQQDSQDRDADGFVVPPRPGRAKKQGQESRLVERIDELMQQLKEEREENKEEIERQRKESEEKIERQRQENEGLKQQLNKLMETLTQSLSASSKQRVKK